MINLHMHQKKLLNNKKKIINLLRAVLLILVL